VNAAAARATIMIVIVMAPSAAVSIECRLVFGDDPVEIPAERLDADSRCRLAGILEHPDISSVLGPDRTPIAAAFYEYLLDRPLLVAGLLERLGMGRYRIEGKGPNRYWVDDGEGADGMVTLLVQDGHTRIYYIDGRHRSRFFPDIQAATAVVMQVRAIDEPGGQSVQTSMRAYTRFKDGVVTDLLRFFRPLVIGPVTRALAKEFTLTHRLGEAIAQDPARVRREVQSLSPETGQDRDALLALLAGVPVPAHPSSSQPAR
jgi:hypothetical protein